MQTQTRPHRHTEAASWILRAFLPRILQAFPRRILPNAPPMIAWSLLMAIPVYMGCESTTVVSEPTSDEQAYALASTMDHLLSLGQCDAQGLFWIESDEVSDQAMSGRSTGTAGVIKGLLAGVAELQRSGIESTTAGELDLTSYLDAIQSAAGWLIQHAVVDESTGSVSWNQCIEVEIPSPSEVEECPEGVPTSFRIKPECKDDRTEPAPGFQEGVAGIGDVFLDLYEQNLFTSAERDEYLQYAKGAGDWLLANAQGDETHACWSDTRVDSDAPIACETSLARGAAGIGYFLLRLSTYAADGTPYLNGAIRAADWLASLMIPYREETFDAAYLPESDLSEAVRSGFYHGNAGIAYFFMAMYQETGRSRYSNAARSILTWLSEPDVQLEELDGLTWYRFPNVQTEGTFTDIEYGAAGIGWTFLQAAKVFASSEDAFEPDYLDTAARAAAWLTHPEIAHYYQGIVWWPEQIHPWVEPLTFPDDGVINYGVSWPTGERPWWESTSGQVFLYYTGLSRGGAGIGWFLQDLRQALVLYPELECYQTLSEEVANQASRWLYYKGRPVGSTRSYWSWYTSAIRLLSTREFPTNITPGYEYGMAGILSLLAIDRENDSNPYASQPSAVLGFVSLVQRP